jgi:hypothetical protein
VTEYESLSCRAKSEEREPLDGENSAIKRRIWGTREAPNDMSGRGPELGVRVPIELTTLGMDGGSPVSMGLQ